MLNQRLYEQVAALIGKETKQSIAFAVNTSAHGDHSFGNMYLPASTVVIQHENTSRYIREHLEDDKAFMIKNFGTGRGIEPIQGRAANVLIPKGGRLALDLGGSRSKSSILALPRLVEICLFGSLNRKQCGRVTL